MSKIQSAILNLLKNSSFGLPVKSIAETLQLSRTTALKYLTILSEQKEVYDLEMGQYHIFIHKDQYMNRMNNDDPVNTILFAFYRALIRTISADMTNESIKIFGIKMGSDPDFTQLLGTDISFQKKLNLEKGIPSLEQISELLMFAIDSFCKIFDYYQWRSPIIMEDAGIIILQMADSNLIETSKAHFYLISGLIESVMNMMIKKIAPQFSIHSKVDVLKIIPEEKTVQFRFEFMFGKH